MMDEGQETGEVFGKMNHACMNVIVEKLMIVDEG